MKFSIYLNRCVFVMVSALCIEHHFNYAKVMHHPSPLIFFVSYVTIIQSNLDGSNTDGSFTMANSNSFLSPYEILLIAQENKYFRKFSYRGDSNEYTQHTIIMQKIEKISLNYRYLLPELVP